MTYQPERTDESYQDLKASINAGCCVDIFAGIVLKITSDANAGFVTNETTCIVQFIREDPFEW